MKNISKDYSILPRKSPSLSLMGNDHGVLKKEPY